MRRTSRAPRALALLLVGCGGSMGQASLDAHDRPGVFVRNRSQETLCEVRIAEAGTRDDLDRLEPSEVIAPGGSRYFPLPKGVHSVRLLDCNGDVVLDRAAVRIGEQGVMIGFEER